MNTTLQENSQSQVSQVANQILETLGSQKTIPTTPPSQNPKPKTDKGAWLSKWIGLVDHDPGVVVLKNAVYEFCCGYAENPRKGRRMLVYGSNGTGKSHTAKAVYRWASRLAIMLPLIPREDSVGLATAEYRHWPKVVDDFKQDIWDLTDLETSNLLVLDDIGAEHDPSRVGIEKLYRLLDERQNRWTLITTNILPEAWEEKFERRICDRFFRNFTHVDLTKVPSYSINT